MINEELVEDTSYEAAFWMAGIYSPRYPLDQLGELCRDVQLKLRALACYRLLKHGSSDSFYHNLIRSALTRRHYLRRCIEAGALTEHFRGCSRYLALCDAITANDFALAQEIVDLSPTEFLQGHEYEDDYCYGRVLHLIVSGNVQTASSVLAQFSRYLEGEETGRYLVASALVAVDQTAFQKAFARLLDDRQLEIDADLQRHQMESPHIVVARRVFIEGLAILQLAERVGLRTEHEYRFCPSIARIAMVRPFPGE